MVLTNTFGSDGGYLNISNGVGYNQNFSLGSITPFPVPVYPTISSSPSCPYTGSCSGGSTNQTQVYTYEGIINLPYARNDWTITAAMYARNPQITTVNFSDDYSICVQIINNTSAVGVITRHFGIIILPDIFVLFLIKRFNCCI